MEHTLRVGQSASPTAGVRARAGSGGKHAEMGESEPLEAFRLRTHSDRTGSRGSLGSHHSVKNGPGLIKARTMSNGTHSGPPTTPLSRKLQTQDSNLSRMSSGSRVANEHLVIEKPEEAPAQPRPRRRSRIGVGEPSAPGWGRVRHTLLNPNLGKNYTVTSKYIAPQRTLSKEDESPAGPVTLRQTGIARCFTRPYRSQAAVDNMSVRAIDPESLFNRVWSVVMSVTIISQVYALTYQAGFLAHLPANWPTSLDWFFLVCDSLYVVDIVCKQYLGYFDAGNKVLDLKLIRRKYVSSCTCHMMCNLSQVLAICTHDSRCGVSCAHRPHRRGHRLGQLVLPCPEAPALTPTHSYIPDILVKWEGYVSVRRRTVSRFFITLFYGMSLAHVVGMAWLFIVRLDSQENIGVGLAPSHEVLALPSASLYLRALYWGFGTTVGTINPAEPTPGLQTAWAVIVSMMGMLFVAYIIGSVHRMVGQSQRSHAAVRNKLAKITHFMRHNHLPEDLLNRVLQYHSFVDEDGSATAERALAELPRCMRFSVNFELVSETVHKVPLFNGCDDGLVRSLVPLLRPQTAASGERVIVADSFVDAMYIVHWGHLRVTFAKELSEIGHDSASEPQRTSSAGRTTDTESKNGEEDEDEGEYSELAAGSFFGQMDAAATSTFNVTAITFCHLYVISTDTLQKLLMVFPEAAARVRENQASLAGTDNIGCFFAGTDPLDAAGLSPTILTRVLSRVSGHSTRVAPTSFRTSAFGSSLLRGTHLASTGSLPRKIRFPLSPGSHHRSPPASPTHQAQPPGAVNTSAITPLSRVTASTTGSPPAGSAPSQYLFRSRGTPQSASNPSSPHTPGSHVQAQLEADVCSPNASVSNAGRTSAATNGRTSATSAARSTAPRPSPASLGLGADVSVVTSAYTVDTDRGLRTPDRDHEGSDRAFMEQLEQAGRGSSRKRGLGAGEVLTGASMRSHAPVKAKAPFIILPSSRLHRWRLVGMIAAVYYSALMVPFEIVFMPYSLPGMVTAMDVCVELIFLFEIALNFRTAFYSRGMLQKDPQVTALKYLQSAFVLDFFSAVPLGLGMLWAGYNPLLGLNKLLRVVRLNSWVEQITVHSRRYYQWRLLKLLGMLFIAYHWAASVYFYFVRIDGYGNTQSWLPDGQVFRHADPFTQYARALWFIVKPRGMGRHLNPTTDATTLFSLVLMAFGFALYAYLIGNIGTLLTTADATAAEFRRRKELVEVFMERRHMPRSLHQRVLEFFEVWWHAARGVEPRSVLGELPPALQTDVMVYLCEKSIRKVALFADIPDPMLREMVADVAIEVLPPGQEVFKEGDVGHEMYFVVRGELDIFASNDDGDRLFLKTIGQGSFFGEGSLLHHRRSACVQTRTVCELIVWDFVCARRVMDMYPALWVKLKVLANRRKRIVEAKQTLIDPSETAGHGLMPGFRTTEMKRAVAMSLLAFLDGPRHATSGTKDTGEFVDMLVAQHGLRAGPKPKPRSHGHGYESRHDARLNESTAVAASEEDIARAQQIHSNRATTFMMGGELVSPDGRSVRQPPATAMVLPGGAPSFTDRAMPTMLPEPGQVRLPPIEGSGWLDEAGSSYDEPESKVDLDTHHEDAGDNDDDDDDDEAKAPL